MPGLAWLSSPLFALPRITGPSTVCPVAQRDQRGNDPGRFATKLEAYVLPPTAAADRIDVRSGQPAA
jgi:hypothetical protein